MRVSCVIYKLAALLCFVACGASARSQSSCNVRVRIDGGVVCGLSRWAEDGKVYASFRGVPYARQPLKELRFKELQPLEPWHNVLDATEDGPMCPQTDLLYKDLTQSRAMSEACIHANIHVPIEALPNENPSVPPKYNGISYEGDKSLKRNGVPILVFIHGGGFSFGSGTPELHGPEYLVTKGVIVITFNYRLGPFGFLSLNTSSIPGNNGLRDMITLLRWVQTNARAFGGDPDNVTLGGQSAGSCAAHLLSLSQASEGLFHRVLMMSGTGPRSPFTTSPVQAQFLARLFLYKLGINSTDSEEIHRTLIDMPLENIIEANSVLQNFFGINSFVPVVETPFPGVSTILDDDPEALVAKGRGSNIPIMAGFATDECEIFRHRFNEIDIIKRTKDNPVILVSPSFIYKMDPAAQLKAAKLIEKKYFNGSQTIDNYIKLCSDMYFMFPTIKVAKWRASQISAAPLFLYQFAYEGDSSAIRDALNLKFKGTTHIEDMTYVFRAGSVLGNHRSFPPQTRDDLMKQWMVTLVTNFMTCSDPVCNNRQSSPWPPATKTNFQYQLIEFPSMYRLKHLTPYQEDTERFFDSLSP